MGGTNVPSIRIVVAGSRQPDGWGADLWLDPEGEVKGELKRWAEGRTTDLVSVAFRVTTRNHGELMAVLATLPPNMPPQKPDNSLAIIGYGEPERAWYLTSIDSYEDSSKEIEVWQMVTALLACARSSYTY